MPTIALIFLAAKVHKNHQDVETINKVTFPTSRQLNVIVAEEIVFQTVIRFYVILNRFGSLNGMNETRKIT